MSSFSADLVFAHRLADEADRVSMLHFRSDEVRFTTKADGTPVAIADQLVEKAMLRLVLAEQPEDSLVGEEIGSIPGLADAAVDLRRDRRHPQLRPGVAPGGGRSSRFSATASRRSAW